MPITYKEVTVFYLQNCSDLYDNYKNFKKVDEKSNMKSAAEYLCLSWHYRNKNKS